MAKTKQKKSATGSVIEFVTIVAVALGLALGIQAFIVKPYRIPSGSMEPTLTIGQRVLVDRVSKHFTSFHRGDVVVFKPPAGANEETQCGDASKPPDEPCPTPTPKQADTNFIKRIIGLPGDHLKVIKGRAYINGRELNEPYIRPDPSCPICNEPREITIPPGHFFMMGDNRGQSDDSRDWGPVPKGWIIGKAFFTYWPPHRIGTL
ncbi:MAG TPA: signal peptidase I [Thermoleophilaceae bacterium]